MVRNLVQERRRKRSVVLFVFRRANGILVWNSEKFKIQSAILILFQDFVGVVHFEDLTLYHHSGLTNYVSPFTPLEYLITIYFRYTGRKLHTKSIIIFTLSTNASLFVANLSMKGNTTQPINSLLSATQ